MIIHAHILAWNEERILPFTLDYYSTFCDEIYVYDNLSTDSSDSIYIRYPKVKLFKWDSGNEISEINYSSLKSFSYRNFSRGADWAIVCDCDEFLYAENLLEILEKYKSLGVTVPKINGHDMVSETFPDYTGELLTDIVKIGSDVYEPMCKNIIFNPKLDVQYGLGGHNFVSSNTVFSENIDLKLLHYKFLGKDYVKQIYKSRADRLSQFNKANSLGVHYYELPFKHMDRILAEQRKII